MHPSEEDLVMLYYREDDGEIRAHLETCATCAAAYRSLARVLDACDDLPVPEPHAAFESRIWYRIQPRLHRQSRPGRWLRSWEKIGRKRPRQAKPPAPPLEAEDLPWWRRRFRLRFLSFSHLLTLAAAAALLATAFFAGRYTRPRSQPSVAISAEGSRRVLEMALSDHLERSEMVLTEFANHPDEAGERQRARNLIDENRLYRQSASDAGDAALAQVLDELERVLLDVSHGTDPAGIKSRIESESLLFKLRVLQTHLNPSEDKL